MVLDKNLYSEAYAQNGAAEKYDRKFTARIQVLRHITEVSLISKWVKGDVFDCSVGNGRFIPEFNNITSYNARDYSPDFIKFIQEKFPHVHSKVADLEQGIAEEDEKYDTVFCLRTLFALRNVRHIIPEMCRIVKPGGFVIIDSGKKQFTESFGGVTLNDLGHQDIINLLMANNMSIKLDAKVDGLFSIICKSKFLSKVFNSRYNILPNQLYFFLERLILSFFHNRSIIIAQKINKGYSSSNMEILAIIPARGGSKGIPRKNIYDLCGKPLIGYTIEAALGSKLINKTIVSTDDAEIAAVSRSHGAEVPFTRPDEASNDNATALDVITHALKWLKDNQSYEPDVVVYLQPTSPLRRSEHLDEALKLFQENIDADSLVSVITPPHNCHPHKIMKATDNYLSPYLDSAPQKFDRHNLPQVFVRNGPAILAGKTNVFLSGKLYGEKILPFVMDPHESIDIDEPIDMELAEFYLNRRQQV